MAACRAVRFGAFSFRRQRRNPAVRRIDDQRGLLEDRRRGRDRSRLPGCSRRARQHGRTESPATAWSRRRLASAAASWSVSIALFANSFGRSRGVNVQ